MTKSPLINPGLVILLNVAVVLPSYCLSFAVAITFTVFGVIEPVKPVGCVNV